VHNENPIRNVKISARNEGGLRRRLKSLFAWLVNGPASDPHRCQYTDVLRLDIVSMDGMPPSRYGWQRDRLLDPLRRWHNRGYVAGAHPADEPGPVALSPQGRGAAGAREERPLWYAA